MESSDYKRKVLDDVAEKLKELASLNEAIAKQQAINDIKEMQYGILENLIREEDSKLADEENALEDIKEFISSSRKHQCDNVRIFNNEYGVQKILSNIKEVARSKRLNKSNDDSFELNEIQEVQLAREENQQLRTLLANAESEAENCERKLADLEAKVKKLDEEYKEGSEILRLKSAIALSMQQTTELEIEYMKLKEKSSIDHNNVERLNEFKKNQVINHDITNHDSILQKYTSNTVASNSVASNTVASNTNSNYDLQPITVTSADFEFSQAWKSASNNRSLERFRSFMHSDNNLSNDNNLKASPQSTVKSSTYVSKTFNIMETSRAHRNFKENSQNSKNNSVEGKQQSPNLSQEFEHTTYRTANKFNYKKPKMGD